ncbi:hypothetical protein SRHO_G00094720 [Serrasalmus rhombeus]
MPPRPSQGPKVGPLCSHPYSQSDRVKRGAEWAPVPSPCPIQTASSSVWPGCGRQHPATLSTLSPPSEQPSRQWGAEVNTRSHFATQHCIYVAL